jgi:archaellum biogenesis ATPase FlaH
MRTDEFLKKYDDESFNLEENKKIFYDELMNTEENIYIPIAKKDSFRIFEITNLRTKRSRYFAILENLLSQNYIIVETVEKPRIF